ALAQGIPPPSPPSILLPPRPPPSFVSSPLDSSALPRVTLAIKFYGLDMYSLVVSGGNISDILANSNADLILSDLTAPPSCYSSLLLRDYASLLGLDVTATDLMPTAAAFADDVTRAMEAYVSAVGTPVAVRLHDFCAGDATPFLFYNGSRPINATWPTITATLELYASQAWLDTFSSGIAAVSLRNMKRGCRVALGANNGS
ncbi:hypothetical protein HaLaN_25545, partial [Haematococcus lacustris]